MSEIRFQRIGLVFHPQRAHARGLAEAVAAHLRETGREPVLVSSEELHDGPWISGWDLALTFGGDGLLLRVARYAAPAGVPILGINLGRVGFLTEIPPEEWLEQLSQVWKGHYWVEHRLMLEAYWIREDHRRGPFYALNDVVVGRMGLGRIVRVRVEIDGRYFTTYVGDGLIVATPTGSTAYALAAGGPILPPELKNIVLVPIAPHLSLDRAVVLDEGVRLTLTAHTEGKAAFTIDGAGDEPMAEGDRVEIAAAPFSARFLRLRDRSYFYHLLAARLRRMVADENTS
ncbi:NAD(+)/NADH kinase [Thermoflexus sp.]|uniref:NAD(+)/NADH kinase n=1 Tax=Thermoflexus sp. TaxID=1969742 RepID=UPI0035E402C7